MIKKLFSIVCVVAICFACMVPAFADIGGYFTPYSVTVDTQTGAVLYDQVWSTDMTQSIMRPMAVFVPNGTVLEVTGEREFEGEVYLAVEYKDYSAYVQSSKVKLENDSASAETAYPTAGERKVAVINSEGIALRKGPSLAYEKASEKNIPYGTVLTYSYTNCEYESYAQWAYTEYKGTSGWIYIYQSGIEDIYDCANVLDESGIYTGSAEVLTDGAYLTETPSSGSAKVAENIPAGTVMAFRYFYDNLDYTVSIFVEYNGVKGWLSSGNPAYKVTMGEKSGVYVLAENGLPLYENPLDTSAEVIATLPKDTNLSVDKQYWSADIEGDTAAVYRWLHVNYNGTEGWVYSGDTSEYCYMHSAYDLEINTESGLNLYSGQSEDSQVFAVIPKDTVVTCVYEAEALKGEELAYWSFVSYNGTNGWIFATEEEAPLVDGTERQIDTPFGAEEIKRSPVADAPELTEGPFSTVPTETVIITICAGAAVIAAAVVIIIAVRKRKSR